MRARQEISQLRQQAALQEAGRAAAAQRERKQRLKQQVYCQGAHVKQAAPASVLALVLRVCLL